MATMVLASTSAQYAIQEEREQAFLSYELFHIPSSDQKL